jgi:DedD protein
MRQRLIGALVLLCGGVILWSLLFTGPAASKLDRHSQIPAAPQDEPLIAQQPQRPEGILSADTELIPPQAIPRIDDQAPPASTTVAAKKPSEAIAQTPRTVDKPSPKPSEQAPAPVAPSKPGLDKQGLPLAWVVQVGVFGNADNAVALKKSLQGAGYKSFIDPVVRDGKRLHRVLVGPVLSEEKAISQQGAINKRFKVKSIVNRFEP